MISPTKILQLVYISLLLLPSLTFCWFGIQWLRETDKKVISVSSILIGVICSIISFLLVFTKILSVPIGFGIYGGCVILFFLIPSTYSLVKRIEDAASGERPFRFKEKLKRIIVLEIIFAAIYGYFQLTSKGTSNKVAILLLLGTGIFAGYLYFIYGEV